MREAAANLQALIQSSVQAPGYLGGMPNTYLSFSSYTLPTVLQGGTLTDPYLQTGGGGGQLAKCTTNLPSIIGVNNLFTPPSECTDSTKVELEKARIRQLKAEMRKQRNKEAARRSNLNKKLIRDQLEQKSVELWEENLQLQQDIRNLTHRLRHFRHLHKGMRHVCPHSPANGLSLPSRFLHKSLLT